MSAASKTVEVVTPFSDRSRARRLLKVFLWLVATALLLAVCWLAGFDLLGWFEGLWHTIKEISPQYIVAGCTVQTAQTTLTALAWFFILQAGYPDGGVRYREILAAYATGVAMNGFLPANIGTFVSLLMYVALIRGATFPGVLGATVVEKIFFTVAGTFVYLYLFLSVPGSFDLQLGSISAHPVLVVLILAGCAFGLFLLGRIFWRRLGGLWEKAKQGGAILANRRDYVVKVVLPSLGAWLSKLAVVGIFLAAYGIPVTFHTIMSVIGGNSLANVVSFTPGGVGITQAVNNISLDSVTDSTTATAYSLGQQLVVTAWNVTFATLLVIWVFGWSGGKSLVTESYAGAKVKVEEQKEARAEKRAAKVAEAKAGDAGLRGRLHRHGAADEPGPDA